jgi:hypothetical protein
MKKYIKRFESFRSNNDPVNEELLGGLMNFFKNMWNKATEELKKLGDKPKTEDIDNWIETKIFNPGDGNYLFKSVLEEFRKKPEANNEDCLTLISNILDPDTGALGTQGLQPLYDNLKKVFGDNLAPLEIVRFYFETARNRAIKDFKYAGGPDLKIGEEAKVDPNSKKMDLTDTTHLPDLKKVLQSAGEDNKKKKESALAWVEKALTPKLLTYIKEVKEDQVDEYLKSKGIEQETSEEYKVGDTVVYKRDDFNEQEWEKLSDEEKAKFDEGKMKELQVKQIGIKKISAINGDVVEFEGADFKKSLEDILMKTVGEKVEGQDDLVNTLKDLKSKNPEAIKNIDGVAKLYADPEANKDKIAEIEKQVGGNS